MISTRTLSYAPDDATACAVNAGVYYLPKREISVQVGGTSKNYSMTANTGGLISDTTQDYCLDFVFSAFSEDRVGITRTSTQLLTRIFTSAKDKTKPIAEAMIQAAGDLVAASQSGGSSDPRSAEKQVTDSVYYVNNDYDPFDRHEAEEMNRALKEFGYCIYIDNRNDPYVPDWSPALCRQTSYHKDADPNYYDKEYTNALKLMKRGVLYRPELSHRLVIMRRNDPTNPREPWHLAATEYVQMPNRAPIFALGINRALFVTAETDVEFDNGLLKNITVLRPSELNAFVDIPLYAVRVALEIPAASLRIFQNEAANRKELWRTNAELIQTLRSMRGDVLRDEAVRQGEVTLADRVLTESVGQGVAAPGVNKEPLAAADRSAVASCMLDQRFADDPDGLELCQRIVATGQ